MQVLRLIGIIAIMFITTTGVYSKNLDAPVITCLEVHEAGDVTIYWLSLDPTAIEFKIFFSTDNTTWIQAGSVESQNLNMQYNHALAQANNQIYYYKIIAVYPSNEVTSGVFSTIFLVVDNSTQGTATLLWNPVSTPLPEGSLSTYEIYRSVNPTSTPIWELVADDIENTLFNYIIPNGLCDDSIIFKIEIENTNGCSSVSNITGNRFSETIQPEKPVFDSVSIYNNKYVVLGWEPSSSPDAYGTIIYRYDSGIWVILDTVVDNTVSQYIDSSYQACNLNEQYAIAAMDSCGILSPGSFQEPLRPILLNNISYDVCSFTNSLSWEPYINANPDLDSYQIWSSIDGNEAILIDEISGTQNNYNHVGVGSVTEYSYFIRAIFGNFSSTSCIKSITTGSYIVPTTLYFVNADVQLDNTIDLTIELDLLPNTCVWELSRSDAGGGIQSLITSFDRSQVSSTLYEYEDLTADASTGYYTYSVRVIDSCGNESLQSNTLKTIFLEGTLESENIHKLSWNHFEGWDGSVEKYYIYRSLGSTIATTPYDSTDAITIEYTDNVSDVGTDISEFTYWIQAIESDGNNYGFKEISNSNMVSFFRETELYLPNAFRPDGLNSEFKPVTTGFGGSNYLFQIYNRWGQLIFESTDPSKGWDGTFNGKRSPQGTYIYRLLHISVFNEQKTQQGTVTLIN